MPRPSDTNAVGGAGPAPHQTPVPTGVPLKGGKDPRQRVGGSVQGKETYTHPPAKAPRRITIRISIHAPLRGATPVPPIGKYGCGDFNPRPPCGGDPAASRYSFCLRHFNPRPLAGATRDDRNRLNARNHFNPRPLAGATRLVIRSSRSLPNFNPRPLAGATPWLS